MNLSAGFFGDNVPGLTRNVYLLSLHGANLRSRV